MGMDVTNINLKGGMEVTAALATQFLIVKFGADDDTVSYATSAAGLIGVAQETITTAEIALGEKIEVMVGGISLVTISDTITRGGLVTSHSDGTGIPHTTGSYIGVAMKSGVTGDQIPVLIGQGSV